MPVREDICSGPSALWGKVAISFLRPFYIPSVSTSSPTSCWVGSERASNPWLKLWFEPWIFGTVGKRSNRYEINRPHKSALRTLYRDFESTFEELLDRDKTKTIYKKNLQNLMVEVYKSFHHLNPEYMWEFFVKKDVPYNLRTKKLCKLSSVSSQCYGLNSLSFRGSLLWNTLNNDLKLTSSLAKLKKNTYLGWQQLHVLYLYLI